MQERCVTHCRGQGTARRRSPNILSAAPQRYLRPSGGLSGLGLDGSASLGGLVLQHRLEIGVVLVGAEGHGAHSSCRGTRGAGTTRSGLGGGWPGGQLCWQHGVVGNASRRLSPPCCLKAQTFTSSAGKATAKRAAKLGPPNVQTQAGGPRLPVRTLRRVFMAGLQCNNKGPWGLGCGRPGAWTLKGHGKARDEARQKLDARHQVDDHVLRSRQRARVPSAGEGGVPGHGGGAGQAGSHGVHHGDKRWICVGAR